MIVYLSGPMRGYKRWNFDAFDEAERRWKEAGHTPISPARIARMMGIDPDGSEEQVTEEFVRTIMKIDIEMIYACDAIALLPGWEASAGVTVELALALYLGLKIYDAAMMVELDPDMLRCPWSVLKSVEEERCT